MTTLNLTGELERVITDVTQRMEQFRHIDPSRLLVCVSSTRGAGIHGTYAKIHPLRFPGGERTMEIRRGLRSRVIAMPEVKFCGREMLYVLYFLVPRFMDLPFREKLVTILHELYHISPSFDGDIRRFPGKNYAHGSSTKRYNAAMGKLTDEYLDKVDDDEFLQFLKFDMNSLRTQHQAVVARKMPAPRIKILK